MLHKLWWQETQMFDVTQIMVTRNTNHVWYLHKLWLQETLIMFDVYTNYGYKKHKCLMLHKLWLQEAQMCDVYTQIMVTRNKDVWCLCVKKQNK